ncbi:alpha-isopropylmalate synthase regulatory domain-containing protein [Nocardia cyriacigeorgica]|uniref:2-keto-3-deoxygluconate kinase n=1 Tax=Nocardia cyriacigeorgica TaxID=135487 RepID=A0A6P1D0Z8_9NOCA|nr:alpha-isopropylmalate synthase regulatory domain-containing protein [Nocardia cyriacigeorgica]NEW44165.1 2-keto-3-deoxygluconate kinase [Nocardia cyriacigeorgica]
MTMLLDSHDLIAAAPRSLRSESAGLTPDQFRDRYGERTGPIRLGDWSPAGNRHANFTATLEFAGHLRTVVATGNPVAAMTSALYEEGYAVEILQFHQRRTGDATATFVQCEFNGRRGWGAALAGDGAESTVRAMIAGLNRLGA